MHERVPEATTIIAEVGESFESLRKSYPRCSIRQLYQMSCV
jgi:hypothetical protein